MIIGFEFAISDNFCFAVEIFYIDNSKVKGISIIRAASRVMYPNLEHTVLNSSFTKYNFLQVKKSFVTIVSAFE